MKIVRYLMFRYYALPTRVVQIYKIVTGLVTWYFCKNVNEQLSNCET